MVRTPCSQWSMLYQFKPRPAASPARLFSVIAVPPVPWPYTSLHCTTRPERTVACRQCTSPRIARARGTEGFTNPCDAGTLAACLLNDDDQASWVPDRARET